MVYFKEVNFTIFKAIFVVCFLTGTAIFSYAQSNDQNFPTPITSNQINGTINARDIGDSRLTTYYFTFNGNQGDVFINVVTKNLNGDIDVFAAEGLRPLTKIVVYADSSDNETGRVIYLRKPEKIILRIQGRSPNDDPATFQIKFAGSFMASSDAEIEAPKLPEVQKENESGVIVNSVGTIIAVKPKPTPEPKESVAEKKDEREIENIEEEKEKETVAEKSDEETEPEKRVNPQVVINDDLEKKSETKQEVTVSKTEVEKKDDEITEVSEIPTNRERTEISADKTDTAEKEESKKAKEKSKKEKEPNPLENIRLVVLLKDGGRIERPMSEIIKFGVEKGVLTIIHKDGSISRYSILDVESVTIR